jgi:hypothetical protein
VFSLITVTHFVTSDFNFVCDSIRWEYGNLNQIDYLLQNHWFLFHFWGFIHYKIDWHDTDWWQLKHERGEITNLSGVERERLQVTTQLIRQSIVSLGNTQYVYCGQLRVLNKRPSGPLYRFRHTCERRQLLFYRNIILDYCQVEYNVVATSTLCSVTLTNPIKLFRWKNQI